MIPLRLCPILAGLLCLAPQCVRAQIRADSPAGVSAELAPASGRYTITNRLTGWSFAGDLGAPASGAELAEGTDPVGPFREIRFRWNDGRALSGAIRLYDRRAAALFTVVYERPCAGEPAVWPHFSSMPAGLHRFSYADKMFSPPSFALEPTGTPWLLFDDRARAAIVSPAANFMIARMSGDCGRDMACGLNPGVAGLPSGFRQAALMVFGPGINAAWDVWGRTLTDLQGKVRPTNDADIGLRYLGYWTDHGAYYYYNYDRSLGYEGTLAELARHWRSSAVPIRYLQLDSWWYYKTLTDPSGKTGHSKSASLPPGEWNRYGGLLAYRAHPAVFPDGLAGAQKAIGLPFITHNRWVDPASPYRADYAFSGVAAIDPAWWDRIIGSIADAGAVCYEQDWLNVIYRNSPELQTRPGVGEKFADGMARAAARRGVSLQYCMPLPRYFLQGSRYSNLTTIRTSHDRLTPARWEHFLYTSRLAASIGAWPWTDVCLSTEPDNLLVSVLSAGMVGIGDALGAENRDNLFRCARADGVLVKPDVPLLPIDSIYLADATLDERPPMIAETHTDHGRRRTCYVFAFDRDSAGGVEFKPADLGLEGPVEVLDPRTGRAWRQAADAACSFEIALGDSSYLEIAPFGDSGIAFFGDRGKFVSMGRKRIAAVEEAPGRLAATVVFAAGETSVRLFGYAPTPPEARAIRGRVGAVAYDPSTGRFEAEVFPDPAVSAEVPGGDPIRRARVEFLEPN